MATELKTELKVVMFTDQIGSTARSEQRTPAEKRQVSHEQSALTAEAAGLCRGVIIADTGDGHMLTFGACSDAVLCGHLIQKRVQERNAELTNPHLQFDLHIGMDFGEATMLLETATCARMPPIAQPACAASVLRERFTLQQTSSSIFTAGKRKLPMSVISI